MSESAPLTASSRAYYASGGLATGIINNGFNSFVLLYYSNVLGVPAAMVGTALAIALAFDAVSDPVVGYFSDNLRSSWGRRHPLIYVSILPVTLLFYLLWNPPFESPSSQTLFWYLLGVSIPLRLLLTFYEVPSNALVPELTADYDERTRLLNSRWSVYFFSANAITVAMYAYWLRNTAEHPTGLLNVAGYRDMGLVGAAIVLAAMLISSVGLHRFIPFLRSPPARGKRSPRAIYGQVRETFADWSLVVVLSAGIFYAAANGTINALWAYLYSYYWGLSSVQMSFLLLAYVAASPIAFTLLQRLARDRDKRTVAFGIAVASAVVTSSPVLLRVVGAFPGSDSPWLYPILVVHGLVEMALYVMFTTMLASMMADLVEKRQLVTGARQEGMLFSAQTFVVKITSGLGAWVAGIVLSVADFPSNAQADEIPADTIFDLGLLYAPTVMLLFGFAAFALTRFKDTRADHDEHLQRLQSTAPSG